MRCWYDHLTSYALNLKISLTMNDTVPYSHEQLLAHLNAETGKLQWSELVRHFARGVVIVVTSELDLVEVATAIAQNRNEDIETWSHAGLLRRASDDDARDWHEHNMIFWAVVVAPWVVVQELHDDPSEQNKNDGED